MMKNYHWLLEDACDILNISPSELSDEDLKKAEKKAEEIVNEYIFPGGSLEDSMIDASAELAKYIDKECRTAQKWRDTLDYIRQAFTSEDATPDMREHWNIGLTYLMQEMYGDIRVEMERKYGKDS